MSDKPNQSIETVLKETRSFAPPAEFSRNAHLGKTADYEKLWNDSQKDPVAFWEKAADCIHWFQKWNKTLEWNSPFAKC